ncbi:MAG: ABC transporter permease [Alphaproteobacteria bacterium]
MTALIASRVVQAIAVMLVVVALGFMLSRYVGDPINNLVGQEASLEDRERLREQLGLDDPVPVQFARFVGDALRGEFGVSLQTQREVSELIAERLPATVELVAVSAVFATVFGIAFGIFTAIFRDRPGAPIRRFLADTVMTLSLVGVSLPTFVIGILLILVFAVQLDWLPSFGRGETVDLGGWTTGLLTVGGWRAILMPAVTLGLYQLTLILRLVRAEMLEVLRTDYIRFARARGLHDRAIYFGHALKNTLLPVITIIGLNIGGLVAFSIVTETVFQWPGMGLLFIQAVRFADIPVMSAYLVMISAVFVLINLIVDILYVVIDPRLRVERSSMGGAA